MNRSIREYITRICRTLDYINDHLAEELPLARLAEVACFSPFHFHRIFSAFVGETPGDYIRRLRLECAAVRLRINPSLPISDVAYDVGFSSPAVFARAFRERFGMSATDWIRSQPTFAESKICKAIGKQGKSNSNSGKLINADDDYFADVLNHYSQINQWSNEMNVEFKDLPERNLAYVAHIGPYEHESISHTWEKLCRWAGAAGLMQGNPVMLGISFDDPEVTDPEKCRYYACIECPEGTTPPEGFGTYKLRGGRHAVYRFVGKPEQIKDAYGQLFGQCISGNGWQPADSPCYEHYHEDPENNPEGNFVMDICCPVKPL